MNTMMYLKICCYLDFTDPFIINPDLRMVCDPTVPRYFHAHSVMSSIKFKIELVNVNVKAVMVCRL